MRNYIKEFHKGDLTYDQWLATLSELYSAEALNVEEIFIAGFLLGHCAKYREKLPLPLFFTWIGNLQGWAEIDTACQSTFSGKEVAKRWDTDFGMFVTHDLVESPLLSHQRASLVLLIRTLRESPDDQFLEAALQNVDRLKGIDHKLITKAISWILRTALKQHRNRVQAYVEKNFTNLPSVAVREFRRKNETGTK